MTTETEFRKPTETERSLLDRLLQAQFPGRDELVPMIHDILVRRLYDDGGLELKCQTSGKAPVVKRIPVEAQAKDEDGFTVHVLLHVVDGTPIELEVYKDGGPVKQMPPASAFELIVLPPMPEKGWGRLA